MILAHKTSTTIIAVILSTSTIIMFIRTLIPSWIEPSKVFLIFNRHVTIFNDDHEDILDDRNQEEEEEVHEKDGVEEACVAHCSVGIVQSITSLQGKDRKEARCCCTKGFLELIKNGDWKETDAYIDG